MKRHVMRLFAVMPVVIFATVQPVTRAQAPQAPAVTGAAVEIPGVVKGGTSIERILTGYDGLDDPIGLSDGSLVFSEPGARRLHRLNTRTNEVSVLVADSNESHGVTEDAKGRLISAQAWYGSTRIGVIYPPESRAVLADGYDGKPFSRPNDMIVASNGGVYFTEPGLTVQQAEALVKQLGRPLEPQLPPADYYIPPGGRAIKIEYKIIRPKGIQLRRGQNTL
jgi:gluconolactonase